MLSTSAVIGRPQKQSSVTLNFPNELVLSLNTSHRPPVAVRIIAMTICMSVLLHISKISSVNFLYVLIVAVARSSVDDDGMLCTSGFVDDVTFARNRRGKGNANTPK